MKVGRRYDHANHPATIAGDPLPLRLAAQGRQADGPRAATVRTPRAVGIRSGRRWPWRADHHRSRMGSNTLGRWSHGPGWISPARLRDSPHCSATCFLSLPTGHGGSSTPSKGSSYGGGTPVPTEPPFWTPRVARTGTSWPPSLWPRTTGAGFTWTSARSTPTHHRRSSRPAPRVATEQSQLRAAATTLSRRQRRASSHRPADLASRQARLAATDAPSATRTANGPIYADLSRVE